MRYLLFSLVLGGCLHASVQADVWLQGERLALTLSSDLNWMPSWAAYDGALYQNGLSANGSVLELTDLGFAGAVHLHESLLNASLEVDGVSMGFDGGPVYQGRQLRLSRLLSIDDAYQVAHELTLAGSEVQERFEFNGLDAARDVEIFYPAMSSRVNSFTHWMTFDAAGAMVTVHAPGLSGRLGGGENWSSRRWRNWRHLWHVATAADA